MKDTISDFISIFPFETSWYNSKGLTTYYPGHPFIEKSYDSKNRKEFFKKHNLNEKEPLLILLPGSRQQEINKHWDIYIKTIELLRQEIPSLQVIVGKSENVTIPPADNSFKIEKNAKKAIIASDAAIVASGTATLECAVELTPMVVCYKFSWLSWLIASYMVNVKYSSIVNLIAGKRIVPELLQSEMKPEHIKNIIVELLNLESKTRIKMMNDLDKVKIKLGTPGVYIKIAEEVLKATKQ